VLCRLCSRGSVCLCLYIARDWESPRGAAGDARADAAGACESESEMMTLHVRDQWDLHAPIVSDLVYLSSAVTVVFLFQKERTAKKVLLSRRKSAKFIKETESKKKTMTSKVKNSTCH